MFFERESFTSDGTTAKMLPEERSPIYHKLYDDHKNLYFEQLRDQVPEFMQWLTNFKQRLIHM